MELCCATLDQLIKKQYDGPFIGTDKEILLQVAKAVEYLADKGLVYRNINPGSIFVSYPDGNIPPKIKLVDFSISREMAGKTELSFSGVVRNGYWAAPEVRGKERYTSAVDVFSAGCVFAYFLSGGVHPFGKLLSQAPNIANDAMTMPEQIKDGTAMDLIEQMLERDPKDRIDVHEIPMHPYFWSETKCLEFVQATCSTIEPEVQNKGALFQKLEEGSAAVFQNDWTVYLTDEVRTSLFKGKMPMKDNEPTKTSLFFLLKAIRNKVFMIKSSLSLQMIK